MCVVLRSGREHTYRSRNEAIVCWVVDAGVQNSRYHGHPALLIQLILYFRSLWDLDHGVELLRCVAANLDDMIIFSRETSRQTGTGNKVSTCHNE